MHWVIYGKASRGNNHFAGEDHKPIKYSTPCAYGTTLVPKSDAITSSKRANAFLTLLWMLSFNRPPSKKEFHFLLTFPIWSFTQLERSKFSKSCTVILMFCTQKFLKPAFPGTKLHFNHWCPYSSPLLLAIWTLICFYRESYERPFCDIAVQELPRGHQGIYSGQVCNQAKGAAGQASLM